MTAHTPFETDALQRPGRLRGFDDGACEFDDAGVHVQGHVPAWLRGDLLLNGPALWNLPRGGYRHWFDGLAMLHRLRFDGGEPRYRSRFLASDDYRRSTAAGRPAYGAFGTGGGHGFWRRLRGAGAPPTDNGAVVMTRIGPHWVAQTETPRLTCFDPDTLETLGPFEYEDRHALDLTAAHAVVDAEGSYWNVGVEFGARTQCVLFRIARGGRRREIMARWTSARPGYLHAFAMTTRHAVVWEPALRASPLAFAFSGKSYSDHFAWEPEGGSRIHAISLDDGRVRTWRVPALMAFHAIQAWDEGDEIVLDLCTTQPRVLEALTLDRLRGGAPVDVPHRALRYRLQPDQKECRPSVIGADFELPTVNPALAGARKAKFAWAAAFDPRHRAPLFDRTIKFDLDESLLAGIWQRPDAIHLEPLFVQRPGATQEEDGVLFVPTLADGDAGTVIGIIDAAIMRPKALLHLPQVVPFGFHAAWREAVAA